MKITYVITGATGFIGSDLVAKMLNSGIAAENLILLQRKTPKLEDTLIYARLKKTANEALAKNLKFVAVDFSDQQKLQKQLEALDLKSPFKVIHLAAIIHAGKGELALQQRINIGLTRDLAHFCVDRQAHFIYLSSVVAFGGTLGPELRNENSFQKFSLINRLFPYYQSKRDIHVELEKMYGLKVSLLCPGIVHGELEDQKSSRSHIRALLSGSLRWAPAGGGNIVSLERVVASIMDSLNNDSVTAETKLIVDENISFRDYFQLISELRAHNKHKIKPVPKLLVLLLFFLYLPFSVVWKPGTLLGLFQGSLYLYFNSLHKSPDGIPIRKSLKAAYPEQQFSGTAR